jgi:hypothetical protein
VLVLDDSDVPRAPNPSSADDASTATPAGRSSDSSVDDPQAEGDPADPASAADTTRKPEVDLEVTSWREEIVENGVRFLGTVENGSANYATLVSVEVALYDESGDLIDTKAARTGTRSLAPGSSTTFDISFEGVYSFGEAFFTADGRSLRSRQPASATPPAAEDGPAGDQAAPAIEPVDTVPPELPAGR